MKTNIPQSVQERTAELAAKGQCLDCKRKRTEGEVFRRGNCAACYQAALRDIASKIVTKTSLMKVGRWLPRSKGGRPRRERGVA